MESSFESCSGCGGRLYGVVKHCPYCGIAALPAAAPPAAAAADAPALGDVPRKRRPLRLIRDAVAVADEPVVVVLPPVPPVPPPIAVPKVPPKAADPVAPPVIPPVVSPPSVSPRPDVPTKLPVVPDKPPRPPSKWLRWVILALLIAGGVYWLGKPGKKEDACESAVTGAAQQLAAGDAAGARSQAVLALAACSGEGRVKAREMQIAADKALAAQASCERSLRNISAQVGDHRLQTARNGLNQLATACVDGVQGKALHQQIAQGLAAAAGAETEVRKLLADGDAKGAKAAFDRLVGHNREHADLAALRQEVQAALRGSASPTPAAAAPPVVMQATPSARQAAPIAEIPAAAPVKLPPAAVIQAPAPVFAAPTVNPQTELVQSFLRDAETALARLKFDAAKTYVESARRVDPNNPQAAALARRIKERELQYLRDETVIK